MKLNIKKYRTQFTERKIWQMERNIFRYSERPKLMTEKLSRQKSGRDVLNFFIFVRYAL